MDTTRIARLIIANTACFLAFWIARLAVPWWFGVAALILLNIALPHRNQKLFRLYHGFETCLIIVYLALTADRHTLQELLAILLLTVLFELYFWFVGNLTLAAESPTHFLRISIIACCYSVLGNTDPLVATIVLTIMLAASMLSAVTASDPRAARRLLPGFIILLVVFVAAVASPIVQAPTLPRAAVWLFPGTPASTPKPAGTGGLPVNLPALTLRRVMEDHFWELFGFMYLPLVIMTAVLIAAIIVSISVLHNTWGKTIRALIFPLAVVVMALIFAIVYTGAKTGQIANGIAQAGRVPGEDYNDIIEALRERNVLPPRNNETKAALEVIVATVYWMGASLLLVSIVASIRDMVFGRARYTRPSVTGEDVLLAKTALQDLQACVRSIRNEARASLRMLRTHACRSCSAVLANRTSSPVTLGRVYRALPKTISRMLATIDTRRRLAPIQYTVATMTSRAALVSLFLGGSTLRSRSASMMSL